jgi:hypothetical protein
MVRHLHQTAPKATGCEINFAIGCDCPGRLVILWRRLLFLWNQAQPEVEGNTACASAALHPER